MEEEKEEDRRGEDGCRSFHVCTVEAKERERETERGAHAVVHAGIVGDQRYSARARELETESWRQAVVMNHDTKHTIR